MSKVREWQEAHRAEWNLAAERETVIRPLALLDQVSEDAVQQAADLLQIDRSLARQLDVRMLVIDEVHALLAGTYREQRIILNTIRFLANDLRIPLVCVGTEEAKQALMTDQQLADRFEAAELPAWEDDQAFQQLLLSFEATLPLRLASDFRDPRLHKRILGLTEGVLVRICRLVEISAIEAVRSGKERIDIDLLREDLFSEALVSIVDRRNRRVAVH